MALGTHVIGNLYGCPKDFLEKMEKVKEIMLKVVSEAKLHSVGEVFHQFEPVGATGVILLAESHFSVHTWPENDVALVDILTCGKEGDANLAFDILCGLVNPKKIDKQVLKR